MLGAINALHTCVTTLRTGDVSVFDLLVIGAAISEPSLKFMALGAAQLIDDHSLDTLFSEFSSHTYLYLLTNAKEYNG